MANDDPAACQEDAADEPRLFAAHRVEYGAGERAFLAMREQTAELCELVPNTPLANFHSHTTALPLGQGVAFDLRTSDVAYHRTMLHVARSSVEHYLVTLYLSGRSRIEVASDVVLVRPGDVVVADMSTPSRTFVRSSPGADESHSVTFMLPRGLLAPWLAAPDSTPAAVIPGDEAYGHIVRDHILSLRRHGGDLTPTTATSVLQTLAQLVAGGLRPAPGREHEIASAEMAARYVAIKRHIQHAAATSSVDIERICRTFGISRAVLYRMFEADGGVLRYVRRVQLRRAFAALLSTSHRHLRISELALEYGFANESAFIRAFRREFGLTPGEVRRARAPTPSRFRGDWMALIRALDVAGPPLVHRDGEHIGARRADR